MKSMIYLTFDSNIWVYLLDNSWTASNPLDHLEHWVKEKHVKVLVPDIVITEWNNLKNEQREFRLKKIGEFFNMAQEIIPTAFIDQYNRPDNLSNIVDQQYSRIERFIAESCETIVMTEALRLQSVERALKKLAPNHKKHSVADTLIVLSLIEFSSANSGNEFIFISNNLDDFYEKNPLRIHKDLKADFDRNNITIYRYLEPVVELLKKHLPVSVDVASLRKDRIKAKLEQQIYNPAVSDSLTGTKEGYLENIASLDLILPKENPTKEQVLFALNLIQSDDSYAYYFFKHLKTHIWFQNLIDRGIYHPYNNPDPVKVDKGYTIPLWSPLLYLLTLAGDSAFIADRSKCKQLTDILEEICKHPKNNDRSWYLLIQIIEKLPNDAVPDSILRYIPLWLSAGFDNSVISSLICSNLLKKFTPENPTSEDQEKAGLITKHLFSLKNSPQDPKGKTRKGEYYSPVYMYYLSQIPMDEGIIEQLIAGEGEIIIRYISQGLWTLLFDFPDGVYTTINDGNNKYEVVAVAEKHDVALIVINKESKKPLRPIKLLGLLKDRPDAGMQKIVEALANAGITYKKEENKDYNLEILQVRLFQGRSYPMDSTPIQTLESNQDHEDELVSLFTLMLVKLLSAFCRQQPGESEKLLHTLWNEYRPQLFRRIFLYILGKHLDIHRPLFHQILHEEYFVFSDFNLDDEIYLLLKTNAGGFTKNEKDLIKNIIDAGPVDPADPEYIEDWKFQWYAALQTELEFSEGYRALSAKLNQTESRLEKSDGPRVRIVKLTPLAVEEMLEKPNEEIVISIKEFKPSDRFAEPDVAGLAEVLGKAVETKPDKFASQIDLYIDLPYIYIYYMMNGLSEAWKKKMNFNWEKVIQFCRDYVMQVKFQTGELKLANDHWGADHDWVAGSIARLLTSGMQSDDHAFDPSNLPVVKELLMELTEELELPKRMQQENMDYPTYSLNSTAGKVLRALFDYSLRRARLQFKLEDGGKWEPEIKALFENSMQKGLIDGYILEGMYFQQFMYLDREWIINQIPINLNSDEAKWQAFMGGFLFGRAPTKDIYDLMYPHYERAINKNIEFSKMNERTMVHHLVAFYFWGYELLDDKKLVYQYLQKSPAEAVRDFVSFMSRHDRYYKSLSGNEKIQFEHKVIEVWRIVIERFKDARTEEEKKALASSAGLLSLTPTLNDETTGLILITLKDMTEYYHWHGVIEDLITFSQEGNNPETAKNIGKILVQSTALPLHTTYESDKLIKLVTYLYENDQKETANQICNAVSRQGHSFLRDIYNKYNQ